MTEPAEGEPEDWDDLIQESGGLAVEIAVAASARPLGVPIGEIVATSILAANGVVGPAQGTVSVRVDTDDAVRALNRTWRGQDKPTNVLSFRFPPSPAALPEAGMLGDIAISYETTAREAAAEGKAFRDHLAHLAVHGFLHLLGYDHESDHEAEAMEQAERAILAHLGIPDPYIARGAAG